MKKNIIILQTYWNSIFYINIILTNYDNLNNIINDLEFLSYVDFFSYDKEKDHKSLIENLQ